MYMSPDGQWRIKDHWYIRYYSVSENMHMIYACYVFMVIFRSNPYNPGLLQYQWPSCQIRKHFPRHRLQRKPLDSDPGMHHGTCVTHVPWCMSGSLNRGGGENVPGIPGACVTRNFTYLARGLWGKKIPCRWSNTKVIGNITWSFESAYNWYYNHNKTEHNKSVCKMHGIYCITWVMWSG